MPLEQSQPAFPGDLDDIDIGIVALLRADGRVSARSMARDLGMSHRAVGVRLDRLLDTGSVRVVGVADPTLIGPAIASIVEIHTDGRPKIWDRIAEVEPLNWLVQFDTLSAGLAQIGTGRLTDLLRAVDDSIRPIPGVLRVEVSVGLRFHTRTGPGATLGPVERSIAAPLDVDEGDRAMMHALHADGRASVTDMANLIGRSVPATRQRLAKMLREGAIEIRTVIDPTLTGHTTRAALAVTLNDTGVPVIAELLSIDEIELVAESAGRYDIWCELACESDERLQEIWHRIHAAEHVDEVRLLRYRRLVKDTRIWT